MKLQILGSGGAVTTPRPFCDCAVCTEAREKGSPYSRLGPSVYINDLNLMIDMPEEAGVMLNRAGVMRLDGVLFTHWHPDHTSGMRVLEGNFQPGGAAFWQWPPTLRTTHVYLSEAVYKSFESYHALAEKLKYLSAFGLVGINQIAVDASFTLDSATIGPVTITPIPLAEPIHNGFLFDWIQDDQPRRALICTDEIMNWAPSDLVKGCDLAILLMGRFEHDPLTGERIIPIDHPLLRQDWSFAETLDLVRALMPKQVVFMHIGENNRWSYPRYTELEKHLRTDSTLPPIRFGYDLMPVEV